MTVMVEAELATCGYNGIAVRFPYSKSDVDAMRTVGGRKWSGEHKHWHVVLDMDACRALRRAFGQRLVIGPQLRLWATQAVAAERTLGSLAIGPTAALQRLQTALPMLYRAIHLGPLGKHMTPEQQEAALLEDPSYQAADTAFLAAAPAPLNGNEQGTGKTPEWIAAIWEAGMEDGWHLVVGPKASVDGTWLGELNKWQADASKPVEVFACVDDRTAREATLKAALESTAAVKWVVVNPAMVQFVKDPTRTSRLIIAVPGAGKKAQEACYCKARKGAHEHYTYPYPELAKIVWRSICIDEAHKGSVRNHRSITAKSMKELKRSPDCKVAALSGTPMKKKGGSDIWGLLNFLRPDVFTSYWRFADTYFSIEENRYGKKVGELRKDAEEAFFKMLMPYMLRRTKKEVAPWLPDKLYVPVDVFMTKRQARQYSDMEKLGCAEVAGGDVAITSVIAQFTRLKQFANGYCEIVGGELVPVESPKVDAMLEKMDEAGMFDEGSTRKQLVFSQSKRMIAFVTKALRDKGLSVDVISGDIKKSAERQRIIKDFQEGSTRVLCIVTTAGGVSLTLDAADEVHLLDEMWAPDEDAQAEDRAHRVSRIHQVTVFVYRTIDTIDAYISETKMGKAADHAFIMDVRRSIVSKWFADAA